MRLSELKGISQAREQEFKKLGIETVEQLVRYFPRAYLDLTQTVRLSECYHNDVVLLACRVSAPPQVIYGRRQIVKAWCEQGGERFSAVWFNAPYVRKALKAGEEYLFYGRLQNKYDAGVPTMINPSFELRSRGVRLKGIVPVYPLKGSVSQHTVRAAVEQALRSFLPQTVIPAPLVQKYALSSLERAYRSIHAPLSFEDRDAAAERIALEEYFVLVSAFKLFKGGKDDVRLRGYACTDEALRAFRARFPFPFTAGQEAAVRAVAADLRSPHRMNRLLQGDVGSGKTAVALCAAFMAVASGRQAAILSPTEVLAAQTFRAVQSTMPEARAVFLSGSTPAAEKRRVKAALAAGESLLVCGTHAVLEADVRFADLALCVCDEQQRFGVSQRAALGDKSAGTDMLVMSATPIPRTLSLILYGDLDITELREKPAMRAPVITAIVPARKYGDMLEYIREQAQLGNKTYFICPKIEEDEEGAVMSVTELFEELKNRLPHVRPALLHGKMKDAEKARVMQAFRDGEYNCLVSTTVVEVGVDVPDATIMVIYNAERFGLSQLHQLRGRVGRGERQSYCFLLCGNDSEEARARLSVLKNNADGFKIAEYDLQMRGGGDFLGTRQSGKILSDIRNLRYPPDVIPFAKRLSDEAFALGDTECLRAAAREKYESLREIALN